MTAPARQSAPRWRREDWVKGYASLRTEYDYNIEEIEGELPAEFRGTIFRNGPGVLERGGRSVQHPFDGDGMICAFTFRGDGTVRFRNRHVRTEGFLAEEKADKFLYRGVFGTQKPGGWMANFLDTKPKNIANTGVYHRGDTLMALWEGGQPHALDPQTLETRGLSNLGGILKPGENFSAHPRFDPETGRMVNFGVVPGLSSTISLFEFNDAFGVTARHDYKVPGFAFIHDFALTEEFGVFFQNPVTVNPLPYWFGMRGAAECLIFQPDQATKIHVIPRDGGTMRTYETDAFFVFHHANAHREGDRLIVEAVAYDTFPSLEPGTMFQDVEIEKIAASQLFRFTIELETGKVTRERVLERAVEFPGLNPRKVGREYDALFLACADAPTGNAPLQGVLRHDLKTGATKTFSFAPAGYVGEPLFVPFSNAKGDDEGWLFQMVFDSGQNRSFLAVFDARNIEVGPVAKLWLRHHVPYGLHGSFSPVASGQ